MEVEKGRAAIHELDLGERQVLASLLPACAIRSGRRGSPTPARSGRWSTSAMASAMRRRPTTSPPFATAASTAGPIATGARRSMTACLKTRRWSRARSQPDYALGGHTASLGLCWLPAGVLPGFPEGMVIGQHGSWNRSTLSGYKVIFVPFAERASGRAVARNSERLSRAGREVLIRAARGGGVGTGRLAAGGR